MKKTKRTKNIFAVISCVILCSLLCFYAFGAQDEFEKSISAFPESYKPYLRELHEKYPNWVFEPLDTGLDWKTVIDNEFGVKNLVSSSASSSNLKSRLPGHYNSATNTFVQMDSGFVVANRLAVEYFMDPRNFLSEDEIFQFERLDFSEITTIADVESILKGSFMSDKKITYYDSEGKLIETEKKYSEVILEAGKKYNINPCYIASKIRNEVGADGSGSVSGTNSAYPGIYNFYNIGATDGAGAITRGLKWASEGTTYGRPWNSPEKSIMGGAQYLAQSYIAVGQYNGYIQKFNVNPNSSKPLYSHQYMTNVTGALSQGYTVYNAYAKTGSLYQSHVFSIPVFKNMTTQNGEQENLFNADSAGQSVKIATTSNCNVRTGPSTNNAKLTDSSGNIIQLTPGQQVNVVSKSFTDSDYYMNVLQYPLWVKVSFVKDGKTYEGYVPEDFIAYTSITYVGAGTYQLGLHKGENIQYNIISSNTSIANVISDNTVEFLKSGTVNLTVYDSLGRYDVVRYSVSDSPMSVNMSVTPYTETLKITAEYPTSVEKIIYTVSDSKGNIVLNTESAATSYSLKSLTSAEKYTVSVKVIDGNKHSFAANAVTMTKPYQVTGATMYYSGNDAVISWKALERCEGYIIYGYNESTKKYTKLASVTASVLSYKVKQDDLVYDSYCVRAYCKNASQSVYGAYSDLLKPASRLTPPTKIKASSIKTNSYKLTWDSVKDATSYIVYTQSAGSWKKLATVSTTSYTVTSLSPGQESAYAVVAAKGKDTSAKSETYYAITMPDKVSGFKFSDVTKNGFKLSWNKAGGAKSYKLYVFEGDDYVLCGEYTGTSCSFSGLTQFTEYKYKIMPVAKGNNTSLNGTFSDELSVVTSLEKISGLKVTAVKDTSVTLTWQENEKAESYNVYTYDDSKKTYTKVATVKTAEATVSSLKSASEYKFAVQCSAVTGNKTYNSEKSDLISVTTDYSIPTGFTLSGVKADSYKLSWKKISEAQSYNVYIKSGDDFVKKANVTTNSYSPTKLTAGKVDTYKVSAVYKIDGKTVESELSDETKGATTPPKVKNLTATPYTKSVKLTWSKVTGATHYDVYILNDGEYVLKSTVSNTTCKLTGLSEGTTYRFAVRAKIKLSSGTAYGSKVSVGKTLKPAKVTKIIVSSVTTTQHKVSWSAAKGANYYYVYRYSSSKGKYVKVASTASKSYTFKGLSAGKTYNYIVYSAVVKDGKELSRGDKSVTYKFSTLPSKVSGLKSTSVASSKVSLSWSKVSASTSYQVYYYSKALGKYVLAGTTDKNTYTVKGLSSKTNYSFKVRAVRTVSGTNYYGSYSSVLSLKTK